jgi:ADP-dependent phosphofructokinase/glucokinase
LSVEEAELRLSTMVKLWSELERPGNMVHVEFGHFSHLQHFELFDKYAVRNADSLGMNEVEMKLLLDLWTGNLADINDQESYQPTIEEVLEQTAELFNKATADSLPLSRVHLHPYGSFMMCYKKDLWEDARDAIIKSSIVLPKYCIRSADGSTPDNWVEYYDNF